jgi:hypothetical protein
METEKKNQQLAVIHFDYEGNPVSFMTEGGIMVNATEMAKPFGNTKSPKLWLRNDQAKEFIDELTKVRICTLDNLVQVNHGGTNPGTWMHEDVAMEFARWLSPRFGIWCNDRIKELLTKGQVELNPAQAVMISVEQRISNLEKKQQKDYDSLIKDTVKVLESYNKIFDEYKSEIHDLGWKVDIYRKDTKEISDDVGDIKRELYETYDEKEGHTYADYSGIEVFRSLRERINELDGIIEDKEKIIRLQSKQLDVWETKYNRLQSDLNEQK